MVYLFIGEDQFSKKIKLEKIKRELFAKESELFNFDVLYGRELDLVKLQEVLLQLPLQAKKRIVLIKDASLLKSSIKDYLSSYIQKPPASSLLILDVEKLDKKDAFLNRALRYSQMFQFKETAAPDTFRLSREINNKAINTGLKILQQLLLRGTRPEKILGGLRYQWENSYLNPQEKKRRLLLLLNCDINIKTGRLKPDLALERLLIHLCCL